MRVVCGQAMPSINKKPHLGASYNPLFLWVVIDFEMFSYQRDCPGYIAADVPVL